MTDYAVRTISCISENGGLITSRMIAERENIPQGVLMKVLSRLKEAQLIVSHQGRGAITGGFSLNKPVGQITILDVVEVMEGPVTFDGCGTGKTAIKNEYERLTGKIRAEMKRYTIEELLSINK